MVELFTTTSSLIPTLGGATTTGLLESSTLDNKLLATIGGILLTSATSLTAVNDVNGLNQTNAYIQSLSNEELAKLEGILLSKLETIDKDKKYCSIS